MKSKATIKKEKEMFNGSLPIVIAKVMTGYVNKEYVFKEIAVEVLTVNFNSGTMRVRYMAKIFEDVKTIQTNDISNKPFMSGYKIKGAK